MEGKKGKWDKDDGMEVDIESGAESSLSPSENAGDNDDGPKVDPLKWTVSFFIHIFKKLYIIQSSNFFFQNVYHMIEN